ncbi:MAG: hypothetical protein WC518_03765 [Patescibacteria group bacterium]
MFLGIFIRVNRWLEQNNLLAYLIIFLICLVVFSWLQYAPVFPDPDSFYHVKLSQLMGQGGIIKSFPYQQFTILKDGYIDHHFLYHLFLVPFVTYLPSPLGGKLLQVILDSLLVLTFFWLLKKFKIRGAFWYVWLLFLGTTFIFRISLVKAQPLSIIILFLGVYLILSRRYFKLMALAFVYVWAYGGWFLLLILTLIYIFTVALNQAVKETDVGRVRKILIKTGWLKRRWLLNFVKGLINGLFKADNFKLLASVAGGLLLGVVINPYFPQNLNFYWVQIVQIGLANYQHLIGVGAEWYPYSFPDFLKNLAVPLVLALLALVLYLDYYKKYSVAVKYLSFIFLFFLIATIKSRRNIEYLVPFCLLFVAMVFSAASQLKEVKGALAVFRERIWQTLFIKQSVNLLLIAALVLLFANSLLGVKSSLSRGWNFNYLQAPSEYLKNNSQTGDIVFTSDWDEFTVLFYHNDKNYYLNGLDPTFMYLYNKDLYRQWRDITEGKRSGEIYEIIKNNFRAKYVLVSQGHTAMENNLDNNFRFKRVYQDKEATLYQVL